jgi:predicted DNA-binding protein
MTAGTATTTIRVNIETRDRLNDLLAADFKGKSVDQLIQYLIEQDWRRKALEDWQRLHADPEAWRWYLYEADDLDQGLPANVGEPPFDFSPEGTPA